MGLYEIFQILRFWSSSRGGADEYIAVVETGNTAAPEHYNAIEHGLLFRENNASTASVVQCYMHLLTHESWLTMDSLSIYINNWWRMQWSGKHNFVYFVYSYFNKIPIVVNRKFFVKMNYNSYHLLFPPKSIEFLWFGFWSKRKKDKIK